MGATQSGGHSAGSAPFRRRCKATHLSCSYLPNLFALSPTRTKEDQHLQHLDLFPIGALDSLRLPEADVEVAPGVEYLGIGILPAGQWALGRHLGVVAARQQGQARCGRLVGVGPLEHDAGCDVAIHGRRGDLPVGIRRQDQSQKCYKNQMI
jgi:hypothetical protein